MIARLLRLPSRLRFIPLALALVSQTASVASERVSDKRVLIIGVDGTRPDALARAKTPALDQLIAAGAFTDTGRILSDRYAVNDTISGPGWSSILTGVWADKHGVHDNKFDGRNFELFPHFFKRLKDARPDAETASFVSWEPIDEFIVEAADLRVVEPLPEVGEDGDKLAAEAERDRTITEQACQLLSTGDPTAVFVYLHQVDATGHAIGFSPDVAEYIRAIENVDDCVGQLTAAIHARPTFASEDWLVIVCTDHGGIRKTHSKGHEIPEILTVFLIVSGPSADVGRIEGDAFLVDVAVTALAHLGVPIDPRWQLDGKPVGLPGERRASALR